jgi:TonB family protein
MKYCPKCNTRYDEEIIRFCTKDGTPLVPEEEPNFAAIPSENLLEADEDDPGEVTVVRRNVPTPSPLPEEDLSFEETANPPPQRIVVSTDDQINFPPTKPQRQSYQAPPRKVNTLLVVLLTIIGTVVVLGGGLAIVYLLQRGSASNTNVNANANLSNANIELNTNIGIDSNFNFNVNTNVNANVNVNANKSPTPTPKPSPSPSPTPTPEEGASPTPMIDIRPAGSPTPGFSPTPRPGSPLPTNRSVNGGVLNGRAISLTTPSYPTAARMMHASGQVMVEVSVDESGRVTSARAISGHPLLRSSAESAARQSRINPVRIDNENVKTTGVLIYNFREN